MSDASPHKKLETAKFPDSELKDVHAQLMREKEEPTEGFSPMPIYVVFLVAGIILWGSIYMVHNNAGWGLDGNLGVIDPSQKVAAAGDAGPAIDYDSIEWLMERGGRLYAQNCVTCHQADGNGVPGAFPPLNASRWIDNNARFIKIVHNGLQGPIVVKGNEYNGNMVGYDFWRDRDIAAVTTYVRNSWDNEGDKIVGSQVAEVRESLGGRTAQWTGDELLELHPLE